MGVNSKVKSVNTNIDNINSKLDSINKEVAKYLYDTCIIDVNGASNDLFRLTLGSNYATVVYDRFRYKINGVFYEKNEGDANINYPSYPSYIVINYAGSMLFSTDTTNVIGIFKFDSRSSYSTIWKYNMPENMSPFIYKTFNDINKLNSRMGQNTTDISSIQESIDNVKANSSSPSIITAYTHNTDIYIYIDGKLYKCSGVSVNNIYTFDFEIIRNYMTWITTYDESTDILCIYFHNSKNGYNRAHLLNTNTNSVILAINVYYKYEASSIHSVPYLYNGELYAASEISPYGSIFGERLYNIQSVNISNPDKVNLNDIIFSDDFYVKDGYLHVSSNGDKTGYFAKYKIV